MIDLRRYPPTGPATAIAGNGVRIVHMKGHVYPTKFSAHVPPVDALGPTTQALDMLDTMARGKRVRRIVGTTVYVIY